MRVMKLRRRECREYKGDWCRMTSSRERKRERQREREMRFHSGMRGDSFVEPYLPIDLYNNNEEVFGHSS